MRVRIVILLAVLGWIGWGVFVYRPAPNARPACVPDGTLACSTIDGFPLGTLMQDCGGQPAGCGENGQLAIDNLPFWDGLHPAVVHSSEYALDMARFCGPVLCAISGYSIFVFQFADGSRHAVGVSCAGVGGQCRAVQTYTAGSAG
jgi:hypothetical protein